MGEKIHHKNTQLKTMMRTFLELFNKIFGVIGNEYRKENKEEFLPETPR